MEDREWIVGPRGGLYYVSETGTVIYKRPQRKSRKYTRKFKPRKGSYYRYLQSQVDGDGKNLDLC